MNRGKKLILLAALLAVAVAGFVLSDWLGREPGAPLDAAITLASIPRDTLSEITVTRGSESFTLARQDGGWAYGGDAAFPLSADKLEAMLEQLEAVESTQSITPEAGLDDYGLNEPALIVAVQGEQPHTFALGPSSTYADGAHYAYMDDPGTVYLIKADFYKAFDYSLMQLAQADPIPYITSPQRISLEGPSISLRAERLENGGDVSYTTHYQWFLREGDLYLPLDTAKVNAMASFISGTTWQACVAYNLPEAQMAEYGLDTASATRLEVVFGEGQPTTFTLLLGRYEGDSCYARAEGSDMVYLIESSRADKLLLASYTDLEPDDVCPMDFDRVTAMDISWSGGSRTVALAPSADGQGRVYTSDGQALDPLKAGEFLAKLRGLSMAESSPGAAGRGQLLEITFYQNSPAFPQVTFRLHTYTSAKVLVEFAGQSRILVDATAVTALMEALDAMFAG